ncbi:MAG: hypothetical protein IJ418_14455 [Clostridia bacterium]|nr:hypothetical protein [Clostridia bacterium]
MRKLLALLLACCLLCPILALAQEADALTDMLQKGRAFTEAEDYASAEICFDIAMKLAPEAPEVYEALAEMRIRRGALEEALAAVEQGLQFAPAQGSLYGTKAAVLFLMGRFEEAALAIRYAEICGSVSLDHVYVTAAVAYESAGYYEEALAMFDRVPQESWWDAHSGAYGRALVFTGNRDRAAELGLITISARNETLAAAQQAGRAISLTASTPDVTECPLFCSLAYYEENRESAEASGLTFELAPDGKRIRFSNRLSDTGMDNPQLLTASPSGHVLLYNINGQLAIYRNGELTAVTANAARGDQNEEYAPLTYRYAERAGQYFEQDSAVWSPDERYFALIFPNRTMVNAQYMDLMLVDVFTGDLFVPEATPKKATLDGCQTAFAACFDQTGSSVYYLVYGSIADDARCGLKRCNLETGEVELLCTFGDLTVDRPRLTMGADGVLHCVTDVWQSDAHAARLRIYPDEGTWTYEAAPFSASAALQSPIRCLDSANSRMALLLNRCTLAPSGFTYLTLSDDAQAASGMDTAVMLPAEGSGTAIRVALDDALAEQLRAAASTDQPLPWLNVCHAALSPDGYYALVITLNAGEAALWLMDLQTLALTGIALPEGVTLSAVRSSYGVLEWISGDRMVIPTAEGALLCSMVIE